MNQFSVGLKYTISWGKLRKTEGKQFKVAQKVPETDQIHSLSPTQSMQ